MQQYDHIQKEVEQTLNSLEGLSRAETRPFFYTRLKAKMDSRYDSIWTKSLAILARPAVALSILFIFLMINGYLILSSMGQQEEPMQQDYVAQQITYFDSNNPTP